jgi:hypothetical protein
VFYEAGTWVVGGSQAVTQFRRIRREAILERYRKTKEYSNRKGEGKADFHDSKKVLQDVLDWEEYLFQNRRHSDFFTHRIIKVVNKDILRPILDGRITADQFLEKLEKVLATGIEERKAFEKQASESGKTQAHENILKKLEEIDQTIGSIPSWDRVSMISEASRQSTTADPSGELPAPMKTANRSSKSFSFSDSLRPDEAIITVSEPPSAGISNLPTRTGKRVDLSRQINEIVTALEKGRPGKALAVLEQVEEKQKLANQKHRRQTLLDLTVKNADSTNLKKSKPFFDKLQSLEVKFTDKNEERRSKYDLLRKMDLPS